MTTRSSLVVSVLVLFTVAVTSSRASESDSRDPREFFFIQSFGDLPEELAAVRDDGKLGMLLFFEAADCPYCHYMLQSVFNQRSVQDWYNRRFVNIAVDIHGDVELVDFDGTTLPSKLFSRRFDVFVTPVVSFIGPDGEEIFRRTGTIKTAEEFLLLGQYVEGEHYKNTTFDDFSKAQGLQDRSSDLATPAGDTT